MLGKGKRILRKAINQCYLPSDCKPVKSFFFLFILPYLLFLTFYKYIFCHVFGVPKDIQHFIKKPDTIYNGSRSVIRVVKRERVYHAR